MAEIGYTLSSEEQGPRELVRNAARAEEVGFTFALISDHFHPWTDRQGHSPFVWGVVGAVADATERLRLGTGVTCPTIRMHPAIVAHAAATAGCLMPGRFFLGLGTGENLNEHILGDRWPSIDQRLDMLEEAIDVIRLLWEGGQQTHRGRYYTVEQARIYDLPDEAVPIVVAAKGDRATKLAASKGDGLVGVSPDADLIRTFEDAGGRGKPRYGQLHVCWAETEEQARKTAKEWWPNTSLPGELGVELPLPRHFDQAAEVVTEDQVAESVVCGPDADRHIEAIQAYLDVGFDHVYVHQVGPDQDGFFRIYERDVLPKFR
ncbi:MAG TPA: TIGR03557 family F420-dependent LLM class oxidoreductase [Actinomycetota bacterium]|nr:TIGR03557 family F420-dependent LLM class oxidoreductase [Actinomycetota bacterium]